MQRPLFSEAPNCAAPSTTTPARKARTVLCSLFELGASAAAARIVREAPAPDVLEHAGGRYRRAHRLPSGWAYERVQ